MLDTTLFKLKIMYAHHPNGFYKKIENEFIGKLQLIIMLRRFFFNYFDFFINHHSFGTLMESKLLNSNLQL